MLPVLFLLCRRRDANSFLPAAVYAAVSPLFPLVGRLNCRAVITASIGSNILNIASSSEKIDFSVTSQ